MKSDNKGYFKYKPTTKELKQLQHINANQTFGKNNHLSKTTAVVYGFGLDGKITLFNLQTGITDSFNINQDGTKLLCTALYEDKGDIFWVGTETGFAKVKINRNNISNPEVSWFYNNPQDRNSISYNHVTCFWMIQMSRTNIYGYPQKVVVLIVWKKYRKFLHLSSTDGLPDNVVYGILNDESGNIWGAPIKAFLYDDSKG